VSELVAQFDVDAGFFATTSGPRSWSPNGRRDTSVETPTPGRLSTSPTLTDPFFARTEHARKPAVIRPDPTTCGYPCPVAADGPEVQPSVAAAPLVWGGAVTTGVLGFVEYGYRAWAPEEINVLESILAVFAQLQAGIAAEDKLRYLAEHADLTDLHNRRAPMARLGSI
jgi:diguanylate cyclase